MTLQIFPKATLKHLGEGMHAFHLDKDPSENFRGIKSFFQDELEERSCGPCSATIDWLFEQATRVVGISDQADYNYADAEQTRAVIYAAMLIVDWPCTINGQGDFRFIPLIMINSTLEDQESYFQFLLNEVRMEKHLIFLGDTILPAVRVSADDSVQRQLSYNSAFSVQSGSFALLDKTIYFTSEQVHSFFTAHGTPNGLDWHNLTLAAVGKLINHPAIEVATLSVNSKISHMAILQVDRKDCVRVLWYAGTGSNNCLKFLKAVSATFKRHVLFDSNSHKLLQGDAIIEQTSEQEDAEYAFYHTAQSNCLMPGGGAVALPGFL